MTEKYYTPTIEEFHLGFEYEEQVDGTWIERIVRESIMYIDNTQKQFKGIAFSIEKNPVRVKYLNREDIESCGWKQSGLNDDTLFIRKNDRDFVFNINYGRPIIQELFIKDRGDGIEMPDHSKTITMFIGQIKNKSELQRIMKQLNIA